MSYDLTNDADRPPMPNLPGISTAQLRLIRIWSLVFLALLLLFLLLWWGRDVYTNWLWSGHLGFRSVFTTILLLEVWLFVAGTLLAAVALSVNLYLTTRLAQGPTTLPFPENTVRLLRALTTGGAVLTVIIASPIFGAVAAGRWETFLLFFNRTPFGVADPQFGLDVSFYVVTLGMLHFIQGWFLGLVITLIVASLALYFTIYSLRGLRFILAPRMLMHMAVLGVLLMLVIAAGHVLDIYEQVLSDKGVVFGATFTDINARIPVLWLLTVIAVLAAVGFGASHYHGGLRLMIGSFSLWVIVVLLADIMFPALFQRFRVDPNEFAREQPYIVRNIEATRAAYQLDRVVQAPYPANGRLDAPELADNRPTVENIRLWDHQPLKDAYNQVQFMELYYSFLNMDSDRYVVDGRLRQVLVAARELDADSLSPDAQNWVNQRLQYTHGYGIVMSPASGFNPGEGRPEFLIQGIPIQGVFSVTRPEIYYGESSLDFVIVNSAMPEINPNPQFRHYDGEGGIPLSSTLRRLAYAWQFADINILLSDQITGDSRIQYRRQIQERVRAIAPFFTLDQDPYPVLDNAGKLWWFQDVYTTTNRYPYSTRLDNRLNYIRNSVKVVVDAYNGSVDFYVVDPDDPLLVMYRKAFPALFKDIEEMPTDLRNHMRYPVDLFSAQASMYLRYHVTDPQVFFNQANQWAIPLETSIGKQGEQAKPYYTVMQLPGEEGEEFVLMLPFTPAGDKKNLVGWLTARNDWPHYGQLLNFRVVSDVQIDGPSQVEARIENDPQISQQFNLWQGAGSRIIRGQLLVIPIANTILYVEPLYLQSEVLAFPELKKVILADRGNLVMADTLDQGLAMLVGNGPLPVEPDRGPGPGPTPNPEELERIEEMIDRLGVALDDLRQALEDLRESMRGGTP